MNKIISILLITIILITSFTNIVFADKITDSMYERWTGRGTSSDEIKIKRMGANALGIIQIIGYGIAVIMLTIMGMKYMYSATGEKAKIKERLIPYVIGAVLLFGAGLIIEIIKEFVFDVRY